MPAVTPAEAYKVAAWTPSTACRRRGEGGRRLGAVALPRLAPDVPPAVDHAAGDGGADRAPAPVVVAIVADAEGDALVDVGHRAHGCGRAYVGGVGGAQPRLDDRLRPKGDAEDLEAQDAEHEVRDERIAVRCFRIEGEDAVQPVERLAPAQPRGLVVLKKVAGVHWKPLQPVVRIGCAP